MAGYSTLALGTPPTDLPAHFVYSPADLLRLLVKTKWCRQPRKALGTISLKSAATSASLARPPARMDEQRTRKCFAAESAALRLHPPTPCGADVRPRRRAHP